MSWWVMEQVSVNESGTQSLVNIQCDDVSDLPSSDQTATAGYTIVRGSQAKVLATSENYILGSTGTWVKMEDGVKLDLTGYATTQDLTDGLANKVDTSVYSSGQAAQEAEIGVVAALGAKNLLPTRNNSGTINGVTFTVQEDGQIVVNGTATNGDANYYGNNLDVDGSYRVSGCPSGGNFGTGYSCYWSGANVAETGSGARFTRTGTVTFRIIIRNGTTVNNLVFKPMIRRAEITDSTYVPYAPTNRELYEMILALQ